MQGLDGRKTQHSKRDTFTHNDRSKLTAATMGANNYAYDYDNIGNRPLAIQQSGTWYVYGTDLPKNITELYSTSGYIHTAYTYPPYGLVTSSGNVTQPIQWSSEYADTGLVYYNYRHYNPLDGRWTGRDNLGGNGKQNLYTMAKNATAHTIDSLGQIGLEQYEYVQNKVGINCPAELGCECCCAKYKVNGIQ